MSLGSSLFQFLKWNNLFAKPFFLIATLMKRAALSFLITFLYDTN